MGVALNVLLARIGRSRKVPRNPSRASTWGRTEGIDIQLGRVLGLLGFQFHPAVGHPKFICSRLFSSSCAWLVFRPACSCRSSRPTTLPQTTSTSTPPTQGLEPEVERILANQKADRRRLEELHEEEKEQMKKDFEQRVERRLKEQKDAFNEQMEQVVPT